MQRTPRVLIRRVRRLDLLNADLGTENEAKEFKKKRAKVNTSRKRRKPSSDAAFHFIAYVPIEGKVWQLNGLENHPVCIGKSSPSRTDRGTPANATQVRTKTRTG